MERKWRNLTLLCLAELLAMTLWFSASAVVPQLTAEWDLNTGQKSWLTMSVQMGFVLGAVLSALLNLPDRIPTRRLFAVSASSGALINAAIPLLAPGLRPTVFLRFLTGATLAGVYPTGMKLMTTWCKKDRGLGIGLLVGALTLGAAVPHLLNVIPFFGQSGMPSWRPVLLTTSVMATIAAIIAVILIEVGPLQSQVAPFNWRVAIRSFSHKPTRLANFGYLGHMWELYAMWTWVPVFLIASYDSVNWKLGMARLAGFGVVAVGALGCVLGGILADRLGRTKVTIWSLLISGSCALTVGAFFKNPGLLTLLCLLWGFSVVADSAQFSTAVTELTDPRYTGTALTVQTSLGFLLTLFTIRIVPLLAETVGWEWVFTVLALGPAFGILNMLRLRRLPEAARMASGHR